MTSRLAFGFLVPALCLLAACSDSTPNRCADEKVDGENTSKYVIERFDRDFAELDTNDTLQKNSLVLSLKNKYGLFVDMYTGRMLEVGELSDRRTMSYVDSFLHHPAYKAFYNATDSVFSGGLKSEEEKISKAFARYHHFFPENTLPKRFFSTFSGFYSQIAIDEAENMSISLEYYLGSSEETFNNWYQWIDGINSYQMPNLCREKIAPDVVLGWLMYQFPEENPNSVKLLDEMVYNGKLMYALKAVLPDESDCNLMGYTEPQLKWCQENEGQMWQYIKEYKHLYTADRLTISKYINPAPTTQFFPEDSPGKSGIWLGWRIVSSFMENNKSYSLSQLMKENDSQKILQMSRYNP